MPVIGYLVPEFPSQTHAFFWREVQALRDSGAQVHLLSTRRPDAAACRHAFAKQARAQTTYLFPAGIAATVALLARPAATLRGIGYVLGLRETPLPRRMLLLGLLPSAARLLRESRRLGFAHVHIHSCASSAHLGALAQRMGTLAYSLTLHGDMPVYGTDHRGKMRQARFVACVARPLCEQVIAATGLPPARVPLVWMGVDVRRFAFHPPRPPDGVLRVVIVARLNWPKGHRFAIEALRRLRASGIDVEFRIVGEGPYRQGIVGEVEAAGLADCTRLLGSLPEEEVATQLAECDVLVLPSTGIGEAAPVAVMEAMASGRPVIASRIGGTPDMIADGVDGLLVPQEDPGALAQCLQRLARDPGLAASIGAAARARAVREFDSAAQAARLLAVITASQPVSAGAGVDPAD